MRVFFALPLSPSSSLQILHWRDKAFPRDRAGIAAENFHITLSFVGEVTSAQCDKIMQSANDLWQNKKPKALSLAIDQYAYWPNPGIFWIGPTILARTTANIAWQSKTAIPALRWPRSQTPLPTSYFVISYERKHSATPNGARIFSSRLMKWCCLSQSLKSRAYTIES